MPANSDLGGYSGEERDAGRLRLRRYSSPILRSLSPSRDSALTKP
jgi:hypothetical protein